MNLMRWRPLFAGLFAWIGLGTAASCVRQMIRHQVQARAKPSSPASVSMIIVPESCTKACRTGAAEVALELAPTVARSRACWTPSGEHFGGRLRSEDVVDPSIKGLRIDTRFDASPLRLR